MGHDHLGYGHVGHGQGRGSLLQDAWERTGMDKRQAEVDGVCVWGRVFLAEGIPEAKPYRERQLAEGRGCWL